MFRNFYACFFLVKFFFDLVVIVLRGLEIRNDSGSAFGLVRIMLGAQFHLFVLSVQTPMYETDENKNNSNLRMQNATGNEAVAAPRYEEKPNQSYPQVHIVNNRMLISSNLSHFPENDPNVVYPLGNIPPNFNASTHGNAPSTSGSFLSNSINGKGPNNSNDGNSPNTNGNIPLLPP